MPKNKTPSKYLINRADVLAVMRLDKDTGKLYWLPRPRSMFSGDKSFRLWNYKHANTEAFTASNEKGYRIGNIFGKSYKAHHVVWLISFGYWPAETGLQVDHINGDTSDNRPSNLRLVDASESMKNRAMPRANKSGYVGVTKDKESGRWKAHIKHDGKQITLGRFDNIEDAVDARRSAERKYGYHNNHGRKRKNINQN